VETNPAETTHPDSKSAKVYRELQALQDELSTALRGAFSKHRQFLAGQNVCHVASLDIAGRSGRFNP
jgi:hypothetical protein